MKLYKPFILVILFFAGNGLAHSQVGVDASDPQSIEILDQVRIKYEAFESINATFSMLIEVPEQENQKLEGSFCEQGDKYRLTLGEQDIYCDGAYIWVHLVNDNEVQVNDYFGDEEEGFSSPKDFLEIYKRDDFIHALVNTGRENGKSVYNIEFKPLEKNSDYSKIRVLIDQDNHEILEVKIFERSGNRYTFKVLSFEANKKFDRSHFDFPLDKYPDIIIEDLRID